MTGAVSWEALTFIVVVILAAGSLVAGFVLWHFSQTKEADKKIGAVRQDLDQFRIEVAKEYAPLTALFKVEARIAEELRSARTEQNAALTAMRRENNAGFDRIVKFVQAMTPTRRSKPAASDE